MENNKDYFVHPLSDVQTHSIGAGTRIWQFAVILKNAVLGKNCNINCHTFIENDVVIGDCVTVKSGVYLWDGVHIGNNVFIGPSVAFVNDHTPRSQQYPAKHIGATLEDYVSIGANATIMGAITIGEGAMIGAGSVVTKNIPPYTLWYGNPAVHKGYVTKEGVTLNLDLENPQTQEKYHFIGQELLKI